MSVLDPRPVSGSEREMGPLFPEVAEISQLPILILNPHSSCNCRCVMCDIWKDQSRSEMALEDVSSWLPSWRELGVERIVLSGGEAMMHSRIWELCRLFREAGIGITILTTGILLKRHAASVVQFCDDLVISLDGPGEVHDRIRNVPGAFEKLADGVTAVRQEDARVKMTGRCTVQKANHARLVDTVLAAQQLGLNCVSFLAADVSSEAFNRPGGWTGERQNDVRLGPDDIAVLATQIDDLETHYHGLFDSGFIVESPERLRGKILRYYEALDGAAEFPAVVCNAPWVSAVVDVDGSVRPCFFHRSQGRLEGGQNLTAILNSKRSRSWRRQLDVSTNPVCRQCVCSLALRER